MEGSYATATLLARSAFFAPSGASKARTEKKPPFRGLAGAHIGQRSMKFSEREMMQPTNFSSFSPMLFADWHFF